VYRLYKNTLKLVTLASKIKMLKMLLIKTHMQIIGNMLHGLKQTRESTT